jgi:hypothetical protein
MLRTEVREPLRGEFKAMQNTWCPKRYIRQYFVAFEDTAQFNLRQQFLKQDYGLLAVFFFASKQPTC